MSPRHARRLRPGFTLIELLIVVAIIGILAAIAIPNILSAQRRSRNASAQSDTKNIVAQAALFIAENNAAPGVASYNVLYDGTAPNGNRYIARATDPWNRGQDYSFTTNGLTGEIRAWSVGTLGVGAAWQAGGTVGFSNDDGAYNSN